MTIWPPPTTAITDGVAVVTAAAPADAADVVIDVGVFVVIEEVDDAPDVATDTFPDWTVEPLLRVVAPLDTDGVVATVAVLVLDDCDDVVEAVEDAVVVLAEPAACAAASFNFSFLIRSSRCFARMVGVGGSS